MSFISFNQMTGVVTIDGHFSKLPQNYPGISVQATQLNQAALEKSGFNWYDRTIQHVIANHMIVYDDYDMFCLAWFIKANISIDFSKSFIANRLSNSLEDLVKDSQKFMPLAKNVFPLFVDPNQTGNLSRIQGAAFKAGLRPVSLFVNGKDLPVKIALDGDLITPLSQLQDSFTAGNIPVKEVIATNFLIWDKKDILFLEGLILHKIKVNLSQSNVSTDCLDLLNAMLQRLVEENVKVVEGSKISLPTGSSRYMGAIETAESLCKALGFKR